MFQSLKQTVQRQIASVGVASSTYIEMEKLRMVIGTLENEIGGMKAELGNLLFEQWKNNSIDMEVIDKICGQIQEKEKKEEETIDKIKQMELERQRLLQKDEVTAAGSRCSSCGYQNQQEAVFCVACGRPLCAANESEESNSQEIRLCSSCGEPLKRGSLYCSNCGTKVGEV